jgi:hypothetical protein
LLVSSLIGFNLLPTLYICGGWGGSQTHAFMCQKSINCRRKTDNLNLNMIINSMNFNTSSHVITIMHTIYISSTTRSLLMSLGRVFFLVWTPTQPLICYYFNFAFSRSLCKWNHIQHVVFCFCLTSSSMTALKFAHNVGYVGVWSFFMQNWISLQECSIPLISCWILLFNVIVICICLVMDGVSLSAIFYMPVQYSYPLNRLSHSFVLLSFCCSLFLSCLLLYMHWICCSLSIVLL